MSSSLILCNNNKLFLDRIVTCNKKWISAMTSSVVGLRISSKALPKAKLAPQKSHGHCLVVCCQYDPLQLSESWRNHYIWEVGSANQWDAPKTSMSAVGIDQHNGSSSSPQHHATTCLTTSEVLPLPPYSPELSPTNYPFFKHLDNFLQGKHFHNQQDAENAFQKFIESWSMDFYASGINKTYFSLAKICWL